MSSLPILCHALPSHLQWSPDKAFPWRPQVEPGRLTKKELKERLKAERRIVLENGELVYADLFMKPMVRLEEFELKPTLRVKGYAHDRVVLTQYLKSDKPLGRKLTKRKLGAMVRGSSLLDKRRESRRGLRIGGRVRFSPARTKFTLNAKNFVKDAAHLLEHMAAGFTVFVTLTLPGGTKDAYKALSVGSGYVVDRFNRWVRYKTDKSYFLYVWEVQKRGAPHLHYMLRMPYGTNGEQFKEDVRREWRQILLDVSEESGIDVFARNDGFSWIKDPKKPIIDIRSVWGNCGSYMAKYMSKSESKGDGLESWHPGRWWGVSAPLRQLVCEHRFDERVRFKLFDKTVQIAEDIAVICELFQVRFKRFSVGPFAPPTALSFHCLPGMSKKLCEAIVDYSRHGEIDILFSEISKYVHDPNSKALHVVQGESENDRADKPALQSCA